MKRFASGLNFYKLFWVFFSGCFLGVVLETIWCLITRGHFESRTGLIYGPFNLVYGFGALLMTVSLIWLSGKRDLYIFLAGSVLGAAFEYLCSYVQQTLFGTVSWDYSQFPLNFHGRVNLLYSLFWGLLAVLWVKDIYPFMSKRIERIPNSWGRSVTWILLVFMVVDVLVSAAAVGRMSARNEGVSARNRVEQFLDTHYSDERLNRIYPNMVYKEKGKKLEYQTEE
ncbi:MAG: putative ABC transporter permease [Clostridia bacterium]|nr:putative ABC transporter permease [Clostridia bacterium]